MEVMVADLASRIFENTQIQLGQEFVLQHGEDKLLVETNDMPLW